MSIVKAALDASSVAQLFGVSWSSIKRPTTEPVSLPPACIFFGVVVVRLLVGTSKLSADCWEFSSSFCKGTPISNSLGLASMPSLRDWDRLSSDVDKSIAVVS